MTDEYDIKRYQREEWVRGIILDQDYDPITNPNGYDFSPDEGF